MILKEKEITVIQDLQTQEKSCIEKYSKYAQQAKDPELKKLFENLSAKEQEHYNSLQQVLDGNVPDVDCNSSEGANYNPTPTYDAATDSEDKKSDCFLATDCIGTEKLVSTEYNSDVFANKKQESELKATQQTTDIVSYKENIFKRIWDKLRGVFKK